MGARPAVTVEPFGRAMGARPALTVEPSSGAWEPRLLWFLSKFSLTSAAGAPMHRRWSRLPTNREGMGALLFLTQLAVQIKYYPLNL